MEIAKPAEGDKEYFRSLVKHLPGAVIKPMFGNLAAFVNGNMFCGLFGSDVGVRLDEAARAQLSALPGAGPFGPQGRPMGEYVSLPSQWRDSTDGFVDEWVRRALVYTAAMPPKQSTQRSKPKPAK
ncbi:MAG: TfoX/Sxy family protein [Acidimicrobiia bacterium]|nr:TfoX/Sxy family protein [Acidimicrobiia bacterium]MDH5421295.1 TfoX/Sxy family protein [Acidimicrobiia bacterium]MDH5503964.1 TfoX/Sxy family protein [Acidimicrobiia bacterium]